MKTKNLFILTALLLPATMFAQSALGQLEHIAGQSIHDVNVPKPSDPVRVDDEEEEESQPQQSTHLKDYTPAQETIQPAPEPKPKTFEELQRERIEKEVQESSRRYQENIDKWQERYEDRLEHQISLYNAFLAGPPEVHPVPMFSSINEHKIIFDQPKSPDELSDFAHFALPYYDSTYTADKLYYSSRTSSPAYFLGRRLENGRTEWRIFIESFSAYTENYGVVGIPYPEYTQIRDVKIVGEGRVVLLEMNNGETYVLSPEGKVHCKGRNVSFPAMSGDGLFIECDGKLYVSNMPEYEKKPLLQGDHFDYYTRTVIVTKHAPNGETYYTMSNYAGKSYDYKNNVWTNYTVSDPPIELDYIAPFNNDGNYYVIKPRGKKYYQIVSYSNHGELFTGKKKYKSLEAAHAGWSKEKATIYTTKPAQSK